MSKKRLLAIIVWFAALATTGAIADVTHTPLDGANPGAATQRDAEEAVTRRLLDQFRTTKIPLSQAVAIAEHIHDGSRTADISLDISGPPVYRVRTVKDERVWENVIDANTGSVTEKEISSSLRELDREYLGNIIALKSVELGAIGRRTHRRESCGGKRSCRRSNEAGWQTQLRGFHRQW